MQVRRLSLTTKADAAVALWLALALGGCGGDGTMVGAIKELQEPGSLAREREVRDDAKCRQYGFTPGTEAYGNCRLQLDQMRATNAAASARPAGTGQGGLSLLCKDAISRGDNGAAFVHC